MAYKDEVLSALKGAKRKPEKVEINGVSIPLYVRSMKGWERSQFEMRNNGKDESGVHFRAEYLAVCLCDEEGQSLGLTPAEVLDLDNCETVVIEPLFEAALRANGMGGERPKN